MIFSNFHPHTFSGGVGIGIIPFCYFRHLDQIRVRDASNPPGDAKSPLPRFKENTPGKKKKKKALSKVPYIELNACVLY